MAEVMYPRGPNAEILRCGYCREESVRRCSQIECAALLCACCSDEVSWELRACPLHHAQQAKRLWSVIRETNKYLNEGGDKHQLAVKVSRLLTI